MIGVIRLLLGLIILSVLAACGIVGAAPSITATAPSKSTPLPGAAVSVAPGAASPWWAWPPGVTTCGAPALLRIDAGPPQRLGDCAGSLLAAPAIVAIRVGQEIDLHMTTDASDGDMSAPPSSALPSSPDDSILRLLSTADNGATGRYLATAPGDLVLFTIGTCVDVATGQQTQGACPVLRVKVTQ